VSDPPYRVVAMSSSFALEGPTFDCGVEHYNEWLLRHARNTVKSGSASVYLRVGAGRVVGYFTVSPPRCTSRTHRARSTAV